MKNYISTRYYYFQLWSMRGRIRGGLLAGFSLAAAQTRQTVSPPASAIGSLEGETPPLPLPPPAEIGELQLASAGFNQLRSKQGTKLTCRRKPILLMHLVAIAPYIYTECMAVRSSIGRSGADTEVHFIKWRGQPTRFRVDRSTRTIQPRFATVQQPMKMDVRK